VEELKDEIVQKIEENRPEDQDPEEIDRDALVVRLPDDFLYRLLKQRLNENECRNRGYILSGYPRTHENACYIFLVRQKKFDEDGNEVEEEEEELQEGEKKTFQGYIPDELIYPSHVLLLKGEDQEIINRMKNLPENEIQNTHYNEADMKRRLKKYREDNNSVIAEPSVQQFF